MTDIADPPAPPRVPFFLGSELLRTPAGKVGLIVGLILLLQIPLMMVSGLITEREARQEEVRQNFQRGWGPEQAIAGPMLVVPYGSGSAGGGTGSTSQRRWIRIPSSRLKIVSNLRPETRRRGLFQVAVYTAAVELSGAITIPALDLKGATVDWSDARLVLGASDLRGLPMDTRMDWNGTSAPLNAAEGQNGCRLATLSYPAGLPAAPVIGTMIPFKTVLSLRGTQGFRVALVGGQIEMQVSSSWPTPSFVGSSLPLKYETGRDGFSAEWQIAGDLATAAWQQRDRALPDCQIPADASYFDAAAQVGVELQDAVPTYLMVSRAAKYGVLFLALSYLTLFLFEMLSGIRIHLVQYGLLGLSVSLFALLLISIAEPLGFGAAYGISTAAVLAQASLYTWSVVRRRQLALLFAGVLGVLFAFLYVVLSLEAFALLAGTVALFAVLSVVMLVTRRVNWAGPEATR